MKKLNRNNKTFRNPYQWETTGRFGSDQYIPKKEKEFIENYLNEVAKNIKIIESLGKKLIIYFELTQSKIIFNTILKPGKYILKFEPLSDTQIKFLQEVSSLNLIPNIHVIDQSYFNSILVMDYFDGIDLEKLFYNLNWDEFDPYKPIDKDFAFRKYLWTQIEKEYSKWKYYGFRHNDLNPKNILASKSGQVIFIDPLVDRWNRTEDELLGLRKVLIG